MGMNVDFYNCTCIWSILNIQKKINFRFLINFDSTDYFFAGCTYILNTCTHSCHMYTLRYVYLLLNQTIQSIIKEKCYSQNINCLDNLFIYFYHSLSVSMQQTCSDKIVKRAFWLITIKTYLVYTTLYNVC